MDETEELSQLVGAIYDTWGNGPNLIQVKPAVKPHPGNATTNITITFFGQ